MLVRTLTGTLFIAVLIGALLIGPYTAGILFGIFVALGLQELFTIAKKNKISTQKWYGITIGVLIYTIISCTLSGIFPITYLALLIPLIFGVFVAELFRKKKNPFTSIAYTLIGMPYIALPFALLFNMGYFFRYEFSPNYNPDLLIGIFILIWTHDTASYLFGKFLGKNKLLERISPKKTWEGSIGGAAMTVIASYFVNEFIFQIELLDALMIALIIIFFGSMGDLIESMLKRSSSVKDSGDLLPGHGGLLDRFDSLLLAVPFIYFYLRLIQEF